MVTGCTVRDGSGRSWPCCSDLPAAERLWHRGDQSLCSGVRWVFHRRPRSVRASGGRGCVDVPPRWRSAVLAAPRLARPPRSEFRFASRAAASARTTQTPGQQQPALSGFGFPRKTGRRAAHLSERVLCHWTRSLHQPADPPRAPVLHRTDYRGRGFPRKTGAMCRSQGFPLRSMRIGPLRQPICMNVRRDPVFRGNWLTVTPRLERVVGECRAADVAFLPSVP